MAPQPEPSEDAHHERLRLVVLAAILAGSLLLGLANNDFPLGYHPDEPKKVGFVLHGKQDFLHPILMLQVARLSRLALGVEDPRAVARLGRALNAGAATLLVLATFLVARRLVGPPWDLLAAATLAATPILVMHAHYFKEDVLLTLFCMTAILAFYGFVEHPSARSAALFGVAAGLAASSHYKSVLLIPTFLLALLAIGPAQRSRIALRHLLLAPALALAVFVLVNFPLLLEPYRFASGGGQDILQVTEGGLSVSFPARGGAFGFHLRFGLLPGLGWGLTLAGLGAFVGLAVGWRRLGWRERTLLVYIAVFHVAIELSPYKPYGGSMRYVLPQVSGLVLLLAIAGKSLADRWPAKVRSLPAWALGVLAIGALYSSVRLVDQLAHDTRGEAAQLLAAEPPGKVLFERYGGLRQDLTYACDLATDDARHRGVEVVVASSLNYDRFFLARRMGVADAATESCARGYDALFQLPMREIRPVYRSFAFSSPTLRIVRIGGLPLAAEGHRGPPALPH
ncbi:MAG TPA: glycosyltransferase family 39 protein [Thermoanaerobaculia bacterium]|nr:glycosyltransferase family 39 protein [Thermoanaerobaculia bacterium]